MRHPSWSQFLSHLLSIIRSTTDFLPNHRERVDVPLTISEGQSEMEEQSPSLSVDDVANVLPTDNRESSKDYAESATYLIVETASQTEDELTTDPANGVTVLIQGLNEISGGDEDESAKSSTSDSLTDIEDESATSTTDKTSTDQTLRDQTEETRMNCVELADIAEIDEVTRSFATTVARIIGWWQFYAQDSNPTTHQISFEVVGTSLTLLMVLALLPEKYQWLIAISADHRSPSNDGENLSWLHEQTTDILVCLAMNPEPTTPRQFGQGLASMVRYTVDEYWRALTGRSWLSDQLHLCSHDDSFSPDLYRFPPGTSQIIFFFNPTEIHWTVVSISITNEAWTYTLYNSLCQGEKGPTWKACLEQFPLLERLICQASGFAEPATREIVTGESAQQENTYDCGPIAVYNAIELLEGRTPSTDVDAEDLRLRYLRFVLFALYCLNEGLESSMFRACMREASLTHFGSG